MIRVLLEMQPADMPHGMILAPPAESEITIREVVESIAQAYDMPIENVEFDTSFSDGQIKKTASNALLQRSFPDAKFHDVKEGITETVKWFQENYENARK